VAVVACERPDRPGWVWASAQRQAGEVQAGRPAFGPPLQRVDVLVREGEDRVFR